MTNHDQQPNATSSKPEYQARRRPYTKPTITRVELRAEEAVLGACKTASTAGPAAGTCATLSCNSIAS
ncbi:MAG: hypothetical protein SNJ67_03160 [Chloracidobacterium sp.]|uniref:Uncharacterized protein n=1 Tax=Chloracidobacterium validum TaxID=2821543 RepID=A0ABX8BCC0_9BACT|nr:hypothetical protein [Chloracidobacterium validum]QUW04354.1 hypothetical protein J8C06_15080 [Chloracidobacterium validum]